MKKIPTIFQRDWNGDRSRVIDETRPDCDWVFDGTVEATRKLDGTRCLVRDGKLYKHHEAKPGKTPPAGFEAADHANETCKTVGWLPVGDGPEDCWHREAVAFWDGAILDGTYELLGPKIQGNPEGLSSHALVPHGDWRFNDDMPRTFDGLRGWLDGKDVEGIVFHHPDGRMAKIKLRDFGLKCAPPPLPAWSSTSESG